MLEMYRDIVSYAGPPLLNDVAKVYRAGRNRGANGIGKVSAGKHPKSTH